MAMDARVFDSLARRLAFGATRRGALRWLTAGAMAAGGVAATLSGPGTQEAAAAKCRRGKKKCRGRCIKKSRCCGSKDCAAGEKCAKGKCVTGQGTCAAGADTCANTGNPFCQDASGQHTCICLSRLQGGTRCGVYGNASTCDQCTTDADCIDLGFPPGSSCTQDFGIDCPICQNDNRGSCIIPCGRPDPT
jgi:hypothetical protein